MIINLSNWIHPSVRLRVSSIVKNWAGEGGRSVEEKSYQVLLISHENENSYIYTPPTRGISDKP